MTSEPGMLGLRKAARKTTHSFSLEPLEQRIALSATATPAIDELVQPLQTMSHEPGHDAGHDHSHHHDQGHQHNHGSHAEVTITATEIRTQHEIIPRFAANPTISTVRSGSWSDPGTWSAGRVPRAGDRIMIEAHHSIFYNVVSNARIDSIEISGSLLFSATQHTRLTVANLTVMPGGLLQIGTEHMPVAAHARAELVFADQAINLANDPRQFGTGLIALGTVRVFGTEVAQTWLRLSEEPKSGDMTLRLSNVPDHWKAGDTLVLPDTRQIPSGKNPDEVVPTNEEEVRIARIVGNTVYLEQSVRFDHLGARNIHGGLELLPHVAHLNRNVIIRSENPSGTRGHTLYTARADVRIHFAEFRDLGRTDAFQPLDSATFDEHGSVTHYGTNQIGRYAVHFHHLIGPMNPTNTGYQLQFVGNTVQDSRRWAVAIHATSFGLFDRNVVYRADGAGFITEDGTEIGNWISNNITIQVRGTGVDGKSGTDTGDFGRGGVGFWFRRGGNTIVGNVAANSEYAGFMFNGYNLPTGMALPLFRGANTHDVAQGIHGQLTPGTLFISNEAYGRTLYGLWAAYTNGTNKRDDNPTTLIYNLKLWHVTSKGVWAYHTTRLHFERLLILGDLNARTRNDTGLMGMDFRLYENYHLVIRNSRIEGAYVGIAVPTNDASRPGLERPTQISFTVLKNYHNIAVSLSQDGLPGSGNVLELRTVRFELASQLPSGPVPASSIRPPSNIDMRTSGNAVNFTQHSIVRVYNYNGVSGDDFQVYYNEQVANVQMPASAPGTNDSRDANVVGAAEPGLTNQEAWSRYGVAFAGRVAPTSATTRSQINGLVGPIQSQPTHPRIVFVTPTMNATIHGRFANVRYNVLGVLPQGASVYFRLNDGPLFDQIEKGGLYRLDSGWHHLSAFIGDAAGNQIPGTTITTTRFFVI